MNADQTNIIRRKIMQLTTGGQTTIAIAGLSNGDIRAEAERFCKIKRLLCTFTTTGDGLVVMRVASDPKQCIYAEIDALEMGQSHIFNYPVQLHQRIRLAASNRSVQGRGAFSCVKEGDALRVVRIPATEAERAACGPILVPPRVTKYDMERLSTVRELRFTVPRADESKLRLAAHRQSMKTGWTIRCRRQDDGSILVHRIDDGAPAQQVAAAGDSVQG